LELFLQSLESLTDILFGYSDHLQNYIGVEVCSFFLADTLYLIYGALLDFLLEIYSSRDLSLLEVEEDGLGISC